MEYITNHRKLKSKNNFVRGNSALLTISLIFSISLDPVNSAPSMFQSSMLKSSTALSATAVLSPLTATLPEFVINASSTRKIDNFDQMELLNPNHVRHLMAYVLSDEGKLTAFMAPLSTSFNKLSSFFKLDQHFSKTENIMASGPAKNRIRRSVRVSANADDIFDVITDIERYKDWSGGCIENVRVVS
jgi:transcription termination factor NusB